MLRTVPDLIGQSLDDCDRHVENSLRLMDQVTQLQACASVLALKERCQLRELLIIRLPFSALIRDKVQKDALVLDLRL